MARRRADRIGLLFLGTVVGFALTVLSLYLFVRSTQNRRITERVQVALGLPREAFELERVYPDGALLIALRQVAFLDSAGDTIVSAPLARGKLDARSMSGEGPIIIRDSEVIRPYLRLSQDGSGEWNVFSIVAVEASGQRVGGGGAAADEEEPAARPIALRGLRIVDGRVRVAAPMAGPPVAPTGRFASLPQPQMVREGGRWVRISWLEDLDAQLPLVRMGGNAGWRVEVASASARVRNPDTRIESFAGWFEDRGDQVIRFQMRELRTPHSRFAGTGSIRTAEGEDPRYDVRLTARPLDFRDLAGMGFAVPASGTATFDLAIRTLEAGRTRWAVTDAQVAMLGSRISGRLTAVTGPGMDPRFSDTRLLLEPLRFQDLETLGYLDRTPFTGEIRGTISSVGTVDAEGGPLRVDLAASFSPRDDASAPASSVTMAGLVRWKAGVEDAIRFDALRVEASPLHLATLRPLSPDNAALLRGTLRGGATLSGSLSSFRLEGGDLAYQVGTAPESRIRGVSGQVAMGPPLRYQLRGRAEPLALATLTELFPSLPFRSATLSGPIAVSGDGDDVSFDVDLSGAAGALAARGSITLGEVARFDVSGRVEAFRPGAVMSGGVPVEGPLTGTFSARGTTQDLRFGMDFAMAEGRLALSGSYRGAGPDLPPVLDVTGRADRFRIGAVLGRPDLLPGPVTGPIRLAGGGRQPYRFDVDLRGDLGRLDVEGFFRPGAVPEYSVRGDVVGLDLSGLPGGRVFPATRLTGTLAVDGRGTTPETFAGTIDFRAAPGSTVGRYPLEAGLVRIQAANGVLRVDTLAFVARGTRLHASGQLGLTRPAAEPLRFDLQVPDLAALRPIIPGGDTLPDLAGALTAAGYMTGTVRNPGIAARGEGRGLRYGRYAAATLGFDVRLTRGGSGWLGTAKLEGGDLQLGGMQRLASLRLETTVTPGRALFSFSARRDATTDLTAAGTLELDGLSPHAAVFDALTLRLAGTEWRLAERSRLGWGVGGLTVENLRLRRVDGLGYLEADGSLPQRGVADLRIRSFGIELAELRRLSPTFPAISGRMALEAAIEGPVSSPQMRLDLRVDSLAAGGVTSDRLVIAGRYDSGRMNLSGDLTFAGRRVLDLRGSVPMRLSLDGVVPAIEVVPEGALTASLNADSLPLALLASATPNVTDARGVVRAEVTVGGTVRNPEVGGFGRLEGGEMTVVPLGVHFHGVSGAMSLRGEVVTLDSLVARTGDDGIARASGTIRLDDTRRAAVDLRLFMDDFKVIDRRDLAEMTGDANLTLTGRFPSPVLSGQVKLDEGTLYIPETGAEAEGDILAAEIGAIGADTVTAPTAGAVLLANMIARDLTVTIGDAVWLQSPDARIQIAGELLVERPAGAALPVLYGDLEAVRGSYDLQVGPISREFEIASGRVQFFGTPEINPALDIVAVHEIRSPDATTQEVTVQVNITGSLQAPRVQLSAGGTRQPLSESEVASLLIFGRTTAGGGSAAEALQAQLPAELVVGYLTSDLVNLLEETLIAWNVVDYVRIRTRPTGFTAFTTPAAYTDILSSISVEMGRELVDDVFGTLELANIFRDLQWGVSLDWDISSTLSLRAGYEPTRRDPTFRDLQRSLNLPRHQQSADLRWRFEYGRPPPQDPVIPRPRREPAPGEPSTPTGEPPPPPPPDVPTPR